MSGMETADLSTPAKINMRALDSSKYCSFPCSLDLLKQWSVQPAKTKEPYPIATNVPTIGVANPKPVYTSAQYSSAAP